MASVNEYSQAAPAQDTYFNTFVPLPLNELTALGMSRKQDLEKNQAMIDARTNEVLNLQAAPGTKDEELLKTKYIPGMIDLGQKYAQMDMSDPTNQSNFHREFRQLIDPTTIQRMGQTYMGYQNYLKEKSSLSANGKYNKYLDTNPLQGWDSSTQGVYNYVPEAYEGGDALYQPYFQHLQATDLGIANGKHSIGILPSTISSIANQNARELSQTVGGDQDIRIFKAMHPDIAKTMTDEQILASVAEKIGMPYAHHIDTPLTRSEVEGLQMNGNNNNVPANQPVASTLPGTNTNQNASASTLYSSDKIASTDYAKQIAIMDTNLSKMGKNSPEWERAILARNDLMDKKSMIDQGIAAANEMHDQEFLPQKSTILNNYFAKMQSHGMDQETANKMLLDMQDNNDDSPIKRLGLRIAQAQSGDPLVEKLKAGIGTMKTISKIGAFLANPSLGVPIDVGNQAQLDQMRSEVDKLPQSPEKDAIDAYFQLRSLDKQKEKKVAETYGSTTGVSARATTAYELPQNIDLSEKGIAQAQKEMRPPMQQLAQVLGGLRNTGAKEVGDVKDITPDAKSPLNQVDIHNYISKSDGSSFDKVATRADSEGNFPVSIRYTKNLGAGKGTESKVFQLNFKKGSNISTEGIQRNLAKIYELNGSPSIAERMMNSDIEDQVDIHKYDDQFEIAPIKSHPEWKYTFKKNQSGLFDEIVDGKIKQQDLRPEEIKQQLYDARFK